MAEKDSIITHQTLLIQNQKLQLDELQNDINIKRKIPKYSNNPLLYTNYSLNNDD